MAQRQLSPLLKFSLAHIAFVVVLNGIWAMITGFSFDWPSIMRPVLVCLPLAGLAYFYTVYRADERIAAILTWTAVLIAYSGAGAMLSYLSASLGFEPWDSTFAAMDRALGFDWMATLEAVVQNPWTWPFLKLFYGITLPLVAVSVAILGLTGRVDRLEKFITSLLLSATVTMLLCGLIPAIGPYGYYEGAQTLAQDYNPSVLMAGTGHDYLLTLYQLRDATLTSFSLSDSKGIITMPSFHAVMAAHMVLAFRGSGWLFWGIAAINAMTFLVTPIDGGHFVVDLIAGTMIALASWYGLVYRKEVSGRVLGFWGRQKWILPVTGKIRAAASRLRQSALVVTWLETIQSAFTRPQKMKQLAPPQSYHAPDAAE